jgi:hypothetical protein
VIEISLKNKKRNPGIQARKYTRKHLTRRRKENKDIVEVFGRFLSLNLVLGAGSNFLS